MINIGRWSPQYIDLQATKGRKNIIVEIKRANKKKHDSLALHNQPKTKIIQV